jgi:hypothetical protein
MKQITKIMTVFLLTAASLFAGELKIEWNSPEDFRDADYYYNGGKKSKEIVLNNLERYFTKEAKNRFPDGYVLTMKVTELDLAGDFEPWRNPGFDDVRIIKDIYPAIIQFDYQLVDADGTVVSEGSERLKDSLLPRSLSAQFAGRSEPYPYVKTLVRDWMRKLAKS